MDSHSRELASISAMELGQHDDDVDGFLSRYVGHESGIYCQRCNGDREIFFNKAGDFWCPRCDARYTPTKLEHKL